MTRRALILAVLTAFALLVPAVAFAGIKRGYYIEVSSQTYIQTNTAATSIKSFNFPCVVDGTQQGGNAITKGIKISSTGAFSFTGKSTLRSSQQLGDLGQGHGQVRQRQGEGHDQVPDRGCRVCRSQLLGEVLRGQPAGLRSSHPWRADAVGLSRAPQRARLISSATSMSAPCS